MSTKSLNFILIMVVIAQMVYADAVNEELLKQNGEILEPVKTKFGNTGDILYWLLTSPYALGDEISTSTSVVTRDVGLEVNKRQIRDVVDILSQVDYATIIRPLYDRVKDIRDPLSQTTVGEALDTIYDIFYDDATAKEFLNRLKRAETNAKQ